MSSESISRDTVDEAPVEDRLRDLEEIREDLELVANSEAAYATYAESLLSKLEAVEDA